MPESDTSAADAHDCQQCTTCCTHLWIPPGTVGPGGKPPGVPCPRLSATGCEIYSRRPTLCADFCCAWLRNESWPVDWRPDRSGLFCLREEIEPGLFGAVVYETRDNALQGPVAAAILESLKEISALIVIVDAQQRRQRLSGKWDVDAAESSVPAPHFLEQPARAPSAEVSK